MVENASAATMRGVRRMLGDVEKDVSELAWATSALI